MINLIFISIHLCLTLIQLLLCIHLFIREKSYRSNRLHQKLALEQARGDYMMSGIQVLQERKRHVYMEHLETQRKWWRAYGFTVVIVLYHLGYDLYALTYQLKPDLADIHIALYIISMTFRTSEHFFTVPSLTKAAKKYFVRDIHTSDLFDISEPPRFFKYGILFALSNLPSTFTVALNASMFYFGTDECRGVLVCIYTWDHWYAAAQTLGFFYYFYTMHYEHSRLDKILFCLLIPSITLVQVLIPIWFHSGIIELTITLSLVYEIFLVQVSHFLLFSHYQYA